MQSDKDETAALIDRVEMVLKRLEVEGYYPMDACCACLHDVPTQGHLPTCFLGQGLEDIKKWKARFLSCSEFPSAKGDNRLEDGSLADSRDIGACQGSG